MLALCWRYFDAFFFELGCFGILTGKAWKWFDNLASLV
jgi:hypothetical protein